MVFSKLIGRVLPAMMLLAFSLLASLAPAEAMPEPGRAPYWAFTTSLTEAFDAPLSDAPPPPQPAKLIAAAQRDVTTSQKFACEVTAASCNYQAFMTPV